MKKIIGAVLVAAVIIGIGFIQTNKATVAVDVDTGPKVIANTTL